MASYHDLSGGDASHLGNFSEAAFYPVLPVYNDSYIPQNPANYGGNSAVASMNPDPQPSVSLNGRSCNKRKNPPQEGSKDQRYRAGKKIMAAELKKVDDENEKLKEENKNLKSANQLLETKSDQLTGELEKLREKNIELEQKQKNQNAATDDIVKLWLQEKQAKTYDVSQMNGATAALTTDSLSNLPPLTWDFQYLTDDCETIIERIACPLPETSDKLDNFATEACLLIKALKDELFKVHTRFRRLISNDEKTKAMISIKDDLIAAYCKTIASYEHQYPHLALRNG